jgi:hypothetical protein
MLNSEDPANPSRDWPQAVGVPVAVRLAFVALTVAMLILKQSFEGRRARTPVGVPPTQR